MANTIRFAANLPYPAWGECFNAAAFLDGMLPPSSGGKSPFELLNGRSPDLKRLRAIGSVGYVHRFSNDKKALANKTEVGILVSYSDQSKCYRLLMDKLTGRIIETTDVRFVDNADPDMLIDEDGFHMPAEIFDSAETGNNATSTASTTY